MLVVCMIVAVVIGMGYIVVKYLGEFRKMDAVMLQDCDVERYLKITEMAVADRRRFSGYGYRKDIFLLMQQRYVLALIANLKLDEAEAYLSEKWGGSRRSNLYKKCRMNLDLVTLYQQKKVQEFDLLYEQEPAVFQKNPILTAERFVLKKQYEEAEKILSAYQEKALYNEVLRNYLLAICYDALENEEAARKCREFVIKYGNTMPCKRIAENQAE